MRKRNMKFMAMFLSLTMVFSMNTFALGAEASLDEIPSEAVQAEAAEGEEPEVVKVNNPNPSKPEDAINGYTNYTDYNTGHAYGFAHQLDNEEYEWYEFMHDNGVFSDARFEGFIAGWNGYANDNSYTYYNGWENGYNDGITDRDNYNDNLLQAFKAAPTADDNYNEGFLFGYYFANPSPAFAEGFGAGFAAAQADQLANDGKKTNYKNNVTGTESDDYKNNKAYAAGFEDGYVAYGYNENYDAYKQGFQDGYVEASAGNDTEKTKNQAGHNYKDGIAGKDDAYNTAYRKAYDEGETIGKAAVTVTAARNAKNYVNTNDIYKAWTTKDAFLASKSFSNMKETGALKDKTEAYVTAWTEGFNKSYEKLAIENGLADGKNAAKNDAQQNLNKVSDYSTKDDAEKAAKDFRPAYVNTYIEHWKTYNGKGKAETKDTDADHIGFWTADDDTDWIYVGITYVDSYKKGYDSIASSAFADFKKKANNDAEKGAYNQGFSDGWRAGLDDCDTGKNDARDAAKKVGGRWYDYCETEAAKKIHTETMIRLYQEAFTKAYEIAVAGGTRDEGYAEGYAQGRGDAEHDRYTGNPYDGFYEPTANNSAYKVATGVWGDGYRAGYDDGYNEIINGSKQKAGTEPFDYAAAEMDPWRISSDPSTWETAQLMVNQTTAGDGFNDGYFDTAAFATPGRTTQFSNAGAEIVATSPFQYYFDLYGNDHLIDKKTVSGNLRTIKDVYVNEAPAQRIGLNNGSIGEYLYAAFTTPSSNKAKKPKKGVSDNGATYVLVRYRLAGAETNENYKVKRYKYDDKHNESVVTETINNYYQGENGSEPVVLYDSRKIAGAKPRKDNPAIKEGNDKANRYVIDAEALVVTWQAGAPAKLVGKLDLNISAKDNVNATVPHRYLEYLGDSEEAELQMPANEAGDNRPNAIEFIQTDKQGASKYYSVSKSNEDQSKGNGTVKENVAFAGTKSAPKLSAPSKNGVDFAGSNAYMNKKGASPSFTLKAKSKDPALKLYMKDVKQALKKATFNFEISRMKLASDYISNADKNTIRFPETNGNGVYVERFEYEDTVLSKLLNDKFVPAPKRSESGSDEKYKSDVENFTKKLRELKDYKNGEEFQSKARGEFEKAVNALKAKYEEMKTKYGAKLDTLQKWIEDEDNGWAATNGNNITIKGNANAGNGSFPYVVTKNDRTGNLNGETVTVPVGNTPAYKEFIPEDADCDGKITAIEHYDFVVVANRDVDDPHFDGKLEAGDNITVPGALKPLIFGTVDYENATANVIFKNDNDVIDNDYPTKITGITFEYHYDYDGNYHAAPLPAAPELISFDDDVDSEFFGKYMWTLHDNFDIYIDFLENRDLDIEIVENNANPGFHVLYPGTAEFEDGNGNPSDFAEIYFKDPKLKVSKKASTLDAKPILKLRVFDGWINEAAGIAKPLAKTEKKLKVFTLKAGVSANTLKKLPKADVQMEQKMAETEPFIVATGINNFEGSIAIRQRKNGDLGYGYFKDDDYYYIFSDEE